MFSTATALLRISYLYLVSIYGLDLDHAEKIRKPFKVTENGCLDHEIPRGSYPPRPANCRESVTNVVNNISRHTSNIGNISQLSETGRNIIINIVIKNK